MGTTTRNLDTTVGRVVDLPVPRTPRGIVPIPRGTRRGFHTQLFRRYQRRRRELDTAQSRDVHPRGEHPRCEPGL